MDGCQPLFDGPASDTDATAPAADRRRILFSIWTGPVIAVYSAIPQWAPVKTGAKVGPVGNTSSKSQVTPKQIENRNAVILSRTAITGVRAFRGPRAFNGAWVYNSSKRALVAQSEDAVILSSHRP